jgi:hypothetical protein
MTESQSTGIGIIRLDEPPDCDTWSCPRCGDTQRLIADRFVFVAAAAKMIICHDCARRAGIPEWGITLVEGINLIDTAYAEAAGIDQFTLTMAHLQTGDLLQGVFDDFHMGDDTIEPCTPSIGTPS